MTNASRDRVICVRVAESNCKVRVFNIRVDLLLVWPVLLPLTAWGVIAGVMSLKRGRAAG